MTMATYPQSATVYPLQLAFHKGMGGKWGAAQFNPQRPHFYVKGHPKLKNFEGKFIFDAWRKDHPNLSYDDLVSREGCIFLEITSATGANVYDWSKKIVMALSVVDLSKLLLVFEGFAEEAKIMHDPAMKSDNAGQTQKHLHLSSPKGIKVGCLLSVSERNGEETRKHTVPLSADEVCLLRTAIRGFIPVALAWSR